MKRSEFKAIVKECLIEILRDNQELFAESKKPSKKRTATKKKTTPTAKRSLANLIKEQKQPPRPKQFQPLPKKGTPSALDMIRSAAGTMNQQNDMGELSSRGTYQVPGQPEAPVQDDGYMEYAAYEGGGLQESVQMSAGIPSQSSGAAEIDGTSHWADLAFFDK